LERRVKKFVAVAGNIGVGKSTLVSQLSKRLNWEPFYEPESENPYLADFYQDMQAWAFPSQIFFLSRRLRDQRQLINHPTSVIQDRTVYEDAEIFARNLFLQGQMTERDYQTYCELYHVLCEFVPPPDLVVYLRASLATLSKRITNRGRDYESLITEEYLGRLNTLYDEWINNFSLCPVLTIPADDLNYVDNNSHLNLIVSKINDKLAGKEEVVFSEGEIFKLQD
jgi:deoxyadenosine/deoxycytidine kinase